MYWGFTAKAGPPQASRARDDGEENRGEGGATDLAREGIKAREHTGKAGGHSKKTGLEFKLQSVLHLKATSTSGSYELLQKGIHKRRGWWGRSKACNHP